MHEYIDREILECAWLDTLFQMTLNNYSLYTRNCYILSLDPGSIIIFMSACTVQADASRHQACMFCFHYRRGIVSLLCINC